MATTEPTPLGKEGLGCGSDDTGEAVEPNRCTSLVRPSTPTRAAGEGFLRTPLLTSCHSPEVDIGEEEQQHQGGHDQPAMDKLDKETEEWPHCVPTPQSQGPRFLGLMPKPENLSCEAPS